MKEDEVDGTCGTYGTDEKYTQCFGGENVKETGHLEDIGVDEIRMGLEERGWEGVEWIDMA